MRRFKIPSVFELVSDVEMSRESVAKFDSLVATKAKREITIPKSDAISEIGAKQIMLRYLTDKAVAENDMAEVLHAVLLTMGTVGGSKQTTLDDIVIGDDIRVNITDFYNDPRHRTFNGRVWTPAQVIRGLSKFIVDLAKRNDIPESSLVLNVIADEYLSAEGVHAKMSAPVRGRPFTGVTSTTSYRPQRVEAGPADDYDAY